MSDCKPAPKTDFRLLDPTRLRLRLDAFDRLHLELGIEERSGPVRAFRCLPLTQPDRYISIQDDEGGEIGIISDVADLDADSRRALEHELEIHYLKARVTAIQRVENRNGLITWDLQTSLGPKTIHLRDRQQIRPLPNGRTMLTDIYGGRFEVPPADKLDARSRHWLEIEL
jgi:hypothetical protein